MREDWIEIELDEITVFALGGDWGKAEDFQDENFDAAYCIRGAEFKNWDVDFGKTASLRKLKKNSIEKRNLVLGDILVEISGGGPEQPVGRTEVISQTVLNNFNGSKLVCTNFLRLIRLSKFTNSEFTNWYLKYFYSTGKIRDYQAGSNNLRNLKFNKYLTLGIPIAPLPEQRAIVAKIEALFSDLDKGIADLKKAQDQLTIYRQAVLKKAFEGELTKEWREQQTDLPTADDLLEQIKAERQKHYEQQLENWKQAVKAWEENGKEGKKPSKPKKIKYDLELNPHDSQNLIDLPEIWKYVNIDFCSSKLGDGLHGTPTYSDGNYFFINGNNLQNGSIVIKPDTKRVSQSEAIKHYRELNSRTVLVSINGTIGNIAFYNDEPVMLGKSACYFNLLTPLDKEYIRWKIESYDFMHYALETATGTTIKNVPLRAMRDFIFPLCSPKEQHQIVQEIESRLSVCDKVEESIVESLEKAKALRQSILKKAFEGRLLSKAEVSACKAAPDYEPASVLLARIEQSRNERVKAEKKKKS